MKDRYIQICYLIVLSICFQFIPISTLLADEAPVRFKRLSVDDGAGAWRDSKSVAFRPEPFGRLAATDRIDCCDSCMFCFVVCLFYEERSTVKVNNMPIRKCADE